MFHVKHQPDSKWQTLKTPIPAASNGALRGFPPSGTGLLEYSFRASPGGTYGSGHSSHQQAGGYSGKRNKNVGNYVSRET
jgi:hypothetical protein